MPSVPASASPAPAPGRRVPAAPSLRRFIVVGAVVATVVFAVLALRLRAGHDPALGAAATGTSSGSPSGTSQQTQTPSGGVDPYAGGGYDDGYGGGYDDGSGFQGGGAGAGAVPQGGGGVPMTRAS